MCMVELGELEANHEEFARRQCRIVAVSIEDTDDAKLTKQGFPHLVVVADPEQKLISAVNVLHKGAGQGGKDTVAPTTILIDRQGMVHWLFRPANLSTRLSTKELLAEVDAQLPAR